MRSSPVPLLPEQVQDRIVAVDGISRSICQKVVGFQAISDDFWGLYNASHLAISAMPETLGTAVASFHCMPHRIGADLKPPLCIDGAGNPPLRGFLIPENFLLGSSRLSFAKLRGASLASALPCGERNLPSCSAPGGGCSPGS